MRGLWLFRPSAVWWRFAFILRRGAAPSDGMITARPKVAVASTGTLWWTSSPSGTRARAGASQRCGRRRCRGRTDDLPRPWLIFLVSRGWIRFL